MQIFLDGKFLGLQIQKEVYGLFSRYHSAEGSARYGTLSQKEKKTQTIVPDLVTHHHPPGSILCVPGPQMWELKRIQSAQSFDRGLGTPSGLNQYYRSRPRAADQPLTRAVDIRTKQVPREYEAKARRADRDFGAHGTANILAALRRLPEVKGLAVGAFGELSSSFDLLIEGMAHEGALKNPERLGQNSYGAAFSTIHWWLKRRWARLALVTAVEMRHDALRYVGGTAQHQAANQHFRSQAQDDWRFETELRQREADF
jgi:hypothetical protein